MLSPQDLFDLSDFAHAKIFERCDFAWEVLAKISDYIEYQISTAFKPAVNTSIDGSTVIEGNVYVGTDTVIEPGCYILGPAIIGNNCHIRHGAYIRGNVILGERCVVGHATEVKNAIFLNRAQAPHFAYIGDSILGNGVNLGAGTRLANVPLFSVKDPVTLKRPSIHLQFENKTIDTGLSKLGAIIGDDVQIGCNVVASPGCIVGPRSRVYALVSLGKGYYPPNSIIKLRQETEQVTRR